MGQFLPLDSYRSVQITSGTQVQDVEVVTSATNPTGIVFTYAVPLFVWTHNEADAQLQSMADYLETLVADHHVTGGSPSQDFDPNNLLADFVNLVVTYDRSAQGLGNLNGQADVPIASVVVFAAGSAAQGFGAGLPDPAGLCDDEYARLAALAGA
jgi:hypothetical protein